MKTFNTKNLMSKKYITPKIMVKRIDPLHLMAGFLQGARTKQNWNWKEKQRDLH